MNMTIEMEAVRKRYNGNSYTSVYDICKQVHEFFTKYSNGQNSFVKIYRGDFGKKIQTMVRFIWTNEINQQIYSIDSYLIHDIKNEAAFLKIKSEIKNSINMI